MTPYGPPSSPRDSLGGPSSRSIAGRVQRDVRLQAALALVVGVAVVAVPLFIWGRNRKKGHEGDVASASVSASTGDDAGPPTVNFGDAGDTVTVDAGGRQLSFAPPRYLKCQNPGPMKTAPEKCDHLAAIEDLVSKAIADKVSTCLPASVTAQTISVEVDLSFKRKKVRLHPTRDGNSLPPAQRKKAVACFEKGLGTPTWDTVGHAHQRYIFVISATLAGGAATGAPPPK